jgi:deoxyribonuclease V
MIAKALGDVRAASAVSVWIRGRDIPGGHRVVRADGRPLTDAARLNLLRDGFKLIRGKVPENRFARTLPEVGLLTTLRAEQVRLERQVIDADAIGEIETIGAVDVAYAGDRAHGAAVVCDADTLDPIEIATALSKVEFPYIPTYLAFREMPAVEAALRQLRELPDVLIVDGHGRLHPARFGFACYVGVELGLPTIGVAKNPLVGRLRPPRGKSKAGTPIELEGRICGYAWRPPGRSRPLYISVGHRVSLKRALAIVQRSTPGNLPSPMTIADRLSKAGKKKGEEKAGQGSRRTNGTLEKTS